MSHVTAQMGSRHLDSPPTTPGAAQGLRARLWSSTPGTGLHLSQCRRGRHHPRRLWRPGRQARGARGRAQARRSVNHCGECRGDGGTASGRPLSHPTFPGAPQGGLAPGRAAILTPPGGRSSRTPSCSPTARRPARRSGGPGGDDLRSAGPGGLSDCPSGGGLAGGAGRPDPEEPLGASRSLSEPESSLLRNARGPAVTATTRTSSRGEAGARPRAGASLGVPGPQAPAPARGGVCNSLESCTEPGSAQPRAAAHGASAERPEGAGRGRGARPALERAVTPRLAGGAPVEQLP